LEGLLDYLKNLAKEEKASFIRICPIWERNEENISIFRNLGFRNAPIHEHPEVSWVLPLDKSKEELLMDMRKTTRYLIRQAQKNSDIEIQKSQSIKDLEVFNRIYQETGKRQKFFVFPWQYLRNEFSALIDDNQILLFLGRYKDEVVSGAMLIFWQDTVFYHQGASLRRYAKVPVNYLLQWEAIKEAKSRGLRYYSFWGIAPEDKENHPWKGLTLFKKGFGGGKKEYVATQDFIISKKYWLNYVVESMRKIKRGFK
jgi:lipid II:glycine glycyltransferase (peptidoglycan interpeptide bridge formation enzyme)